MDAHRLRASSYPEVFQSNPTYHPIEIVGTSYRLLDGLRGLPRVTDGSGQPRCSYPLGPGWVKAAALAGQGL